MADTLFMIQIGMHMWQTTAHALFERIGRGRVHHDKPTAQAKLGPVFRYLVCHRPQLHRRWLLNSYSESGEVKKGPSCTHPQWLRSKPVRSQVCSALLREPPFQFYFRQNAAVCMLPGPATLPGPAAGTGASQAAVYYHLPCVQWDIDRGALVLVGLVPIVIHVLWVLRTYGPLRVGLLILPGSLFCLAHSRQELAEQGARNRGDVLSLAVWASYFGLCRRRLKAQNHLRGHG
ncbi:hypothetical protein V8C86DRAFT_905134 [Haematococcus lacustris]